MIKSIIKFMDNLAEFRPFLDVVLQVVFWSLLVVAIWNKDYENMAIAAWWIILLELVQMNTNIKSLKDNW